MTDDHTDTDLTDHHGEAETLRRENERLRGELESATRGRDEWRNDFRALEKAVVGDTGLSAMTVAAQLLLYCQRAEAAEARVAFLREALIHAGNDLSTHLEVFHDSEEESREASNLRHLMRHVDGALIGMDDPAEAALAASRAPDPVINADSCQPGDLISRESALRAVKRECNAWDRNGTRAAQQMAGCLAVQIHNIPAAPVADAQPVGWFGFDAGTGEYTAEWCSVKPHDATGMRPLYAHPPVQPTIGGAELDALLAAAKSEAAKAIRKFPQPNYVISKVAEEAGGGFAGHFCPEKDG